MRGRLGRGGAGSPGTPDSTGARSPETGAGSLPSRVLPSPPPGIQRHRARNPVILSDHDLAVIQKAVAAARQDGKDDRQDVAAVRHRTGPGPGPPTEEPREIRPPEARCSAPPPAITQAPPAANPAPPWGTVPAILVPVPGRAVGGAGSAPEPAVVRGLNESRTRRLVLYAVAAAIVVVAAALADHGGVLPRVGANNSSHRRRSAVLRIARNCCRRVASRRSCTSATQPVRRRRLRRRRRSRRVRRPGHQARRTPLHQPGLRHLPKACRPRRVRVLAAGRQPSHRKDDIDEDTSDYGSSQPPVMRAAVQARDALRSLRHRLHRRDQNGLRAPTGQAGPLKPSATPL
jgi:hypothetical protein